MKRSDLQYFYSFPFKSIKYLLLGVLFYLIPVNLVFSYLTNPKNFEDVFKNQKALENFRQSMVLLELIIKYSLIVTGTVFVIIGAVKILLFLIKRKSTEEYTKNYNEIVQNFQKWVQEQTGTTNIFIFDSFRPWMQQEYGVKKVSKEVKMFFPRYLVAFALNKQLNSLNILEGELNISSKTWKFTGNWELKLNSVVGFGFNNERITFYNFKEENNLEFAKVHFFEIYSYGTSLKIPVFESEILSNYGDINKLEKEFTDKSKIFLQTLKSEVLKQG